MKKLMRSWVISGLSWLFCGIAVAGVPDAIYEERTIILPEFNAEEHLETLTKNIEKAEPLSQTLDKASKELKKFYEKYKQNPSPVLEAKLEDKLSQHLTRIVEGMDEVIAGRDEIEWALKDLHRETEAVKNSLSKESGKLKAKEETYKNKGKVIEKELTVVAKTIKRTDESPLKRELEKEFRKKLIRHRLNNSYVKGYGDMDKSYQNMANGMGTLVGTFDEMETRLLGLIDSLEEQRELLVFAAGLRGSLAKVKEKMTRGVSGGYSVANIGKKVNTLQGRFQVFNKVASDLEGNLNEFGSLNEAISSIASGQVTGTSQQQKANEMEKAIEYWATK